MTEQTTSTDNLVFEKKHLLAEYKPEILKALEALTKVANRVGVPAPTWTISATYDFEFEVLMGSTPDEDEYESFIEPVFDITINLSECIKMAGDWKLVAAINHREEGIIQIDADFELPVRFSPKYETCEHCNKNITRVMSYVIYSPVEGFKQVGKSCLKQFLGINPTSYISMFEAISKFSPMIESMGYRKNSGGRMENLAYNVEEIFKLTYHVAQREGNFVKNEWKEIETGGGNWRGEAYTKNVRANLGESTLDKVNEMILTVSALKRDPARLELSQKTHDAIGMERVVAQIAATEEIMRTSTDKDEKEKAGNMHGEAMFNFHAIRDYQLYAEYFAIDESYLGLFAGMLDWAKNIQVNISEGGQMSSFDEFKMGIKDVMSKTRTLQTRAKYIVSGYNMFLTDMQRAAEREARAAKALTQQYIGTIGEKSKLTLTITGYKTGEGTFGMWELWNMEDADGNQFSKFGKLNEKYITGDLDLVYNPSSYTTLPAAERAEKQPKITAKFEIKDHKIYKEQKVNELGRISKP